VILESLGKSCGGVRSGALTTIQSTSYLSRRKHFVVHFKQLFILLSNSLDRHTQCHPCEQFILYWLVRSRAEVDGILLLMWDEKVMENLGV